MIPKQFNKFSRKVTDQVLLQLASSDEKPSRMTIKEHLTLLEERLGKC